MGLQGASGHGPTTKRGKYGDVHIKIVLVCALQGNQVTEYWWSVTPPGAQLKRSRNRNQTTQGRIFWELIAYDASDGAQIESSSITTVQMNAGSGWDLSWGTPQVDMRYTDRRHWMMDPIQVPGGSGTESYEYTVVANVAGDPIKIDPEIDFEPGD